MKKIILIGLMLFSTGLFAQEHSHPMEAVERFFTAFHAKDSLGMQEVMHPKARLLRAAVSNKQSVVVENNLEKFIRAVATRNASPTWEEQLGEPVVQQDQNLATVWVPFRFYLGGKLAHCGVNAFTLVVEGTSWKILSLMDTGTKDCE